MKSLKYVITEKLKISNKSKSIGVGTYEFIEFGSKQGCKLYGILENDTNYIGFIFKCAKPLEWFGKKVDFLGAIPLNIMDEKLDSILNEFNKFYQNDTVVIGYPSEVCDCIASGGDNEGFLKPLAEIFTIFIKNELGGSKFFVDDTFFDDYLDPVYYK